LQSFVGDGVRPVLRRKIKFNRIGVLLHSPSRKAPARASRGTNRTRLRAWPHEGARRLRAIRQFCFSAIACVEEFGFVALRISGGSGTTGSSRLRPTARFTALEFATSGSWVLAHAIQFCCVPRTNRRESDVADPDYPAEIGQSDQSRAGASQDATKAATRRITLGSASRGA
jgi:hypothetical protein